MWFLFSIKGRKNELQTKSEQCYIEHGEVKLETGFMKKNLKCFFTFVEGDTRSSWYRYSDGPPPILAMRNFSVKNKGKRYHSNIVFLNSFVIGNKCIGSFPYYTICITIIVGTHYSYFQNWSIFFKGKFFVLHVFVR